VCFAELLEEVDVSHAPAQDKLKAVGVGVLNLVWHTLQAIRTRDTYQGKLVFRPMIRDPKNSRVTSTTTDASPGCAWARHARSLIGVWHRVAGQRCSAGCAGRAQRYSACGSRCLALRSHLAHGAAAGAVLALAPGVQVGGRSAHYSRLARSVVSETTRVWKVVGRASDPEPSLEESVLRELGGQHHIAQLLEAAQASPFSAELRVVAMPHYADREPACMAEVELMIVRRSASLSLAHSRRSGTWPRRWRSCTHRAWCTAT